MICVLSGGTGGAKFVDGLRQVMPAEDITLIVNTGDDLLWWGLYVSPDIDSITYVLSGMLSRERGWGVKGDTFLCLQAMGQLGEPTWFHTGDRDLAMHLLRSRLLAEGKTFRKRQRRSREKLGRQGARPAHERFASRDARRYSDRRTELRRIFCSALVSGPGQFGALRRRLGR